MVLLPEKIQPINTSFYRPKAKPNKRGDPRFWPSKLGRLAPIGTLLYITAHENSLIIVPLTNHSCSESNLNELFGQKDGDSDIYSELISKIAETSCRWIRSCSPEKKNAKDVGDTLEAELGLKTNNEGTADYKGEIELKAKRSNSKTADTLFSQVPDWGNSPIKSVKEMVLTYGYPSKRPRRSRSRRSQKISRAKHPKPIR